MTDTKIPDTRQELALADGLRGQIFSLPALAAAGFAGLPRLPVSLRIVLESMLRNRADPEQIRALANWQPNAKRELEVPFTVSRVVLQDFTGVPLLADLAAMRDAAVEELGKPASLIEPLVPVDLVVDHSVQVDRYGSADALSFNLNREFERNAESYRFLKWGMGAFKSFKVVPPSIG
ncbi:MAG: aconitase family protein, partial [Betaproteobacteria bacterium]|nr:aconitase family protein [Betaproteobacteria bacterium]